MKYAPGTLAAIALDRSGNEAGRTRLISGEKAPILTVRPDRSVLPPTGRLCALRKLSSPTKRSASSAYGTAR